ncbi:M20 family metallopeptidase [Halalkalirubrum salinum]|uniref:M20 family metallopeptidase n=1 Tax=Halalkalirubrum salinum TaxID=2563889 RepID=UPI0010FB92C8|nr:M20/M25/M40 family metallo-hydrolase [Halalkalirubrum salinum]
MTQSHPSHPDTARRERLAESTLDLLAFDTQNPPGETAELLAWLEGVILEWGVDTEWIETVDGKPNLVATIPGDSEWTLLYEGHVDTVPYEADAWEYDPLGQRIDDRLYGRGATDMKGTVAAMIETLRGFATADERPPTTLQFAFVSDEETGGEAGIDAVLAADAISADAAVVGETTATADRYSVAVADKGRIWLTLEASGEAAHGSRPMCGENAVDRLYEVISDCRESITTGRLGYPETVDRIVEETIDYYAASDRSPLASEEAFAYPTVNLGRLEGGSTVNSVPGTATAEVDVRVTPGASTRAVFERIDACLGAKPDVSITDVSIQEGSYTDPAAPFVDWVVEVGQEVGDQRVFRRCATGGGDVKKLRAAGIHAVEAAVGSDTAHQADEYVPLDALEATAEWYRQLPWAVAP